MATPPSTRALLFAAVGLCGGVALGTLLPADAERAFSNANGTSAATRGQGESLGGGLRPTTGVSSATDGDPETSLSTRGSDSLGKLPPEKIIALFERVSKLKSESRKYILAYRLASQMELGQIEGALKAALEDLSDGDYVTTRALARRWAELDPKAAAAKALETKQQHMVIPVMEAWSRLDPAGPLSWALQQDPSARVDAIRPLLMGRLLEPAQLEKLVMNAGSSDSDEMRRQIFPFATASLSESNPQGALHAASSIEDADLRQRTLSMVLGRLGQTAPDVGKAWIASQPDLTPEQRQQWEQALTNPRGGFRRGGPR